MLIVIKGEIEFKINGKNLIFKEFDTYDIPVNEEYEVIGKADESIFIITK